VSHAGAPQQPRPLGPPLQRRIRKVGAPLGVIITLGTVAGLLVILLTAVRPVGTAIGFVLSTVAVAIVVLVYLWLDRWEPEPPRLLVLAFVWGASVAVIISVGTELYLESLINHGETKTVSAASVAIGAPLIEEAAKGDANNQLWAIEAIQDYNPEPDLDKITAKVLLINDAEDHANPPELGTVERAMKRVKHGKYVLISAGSDTHGHFSHFYARLWKPHLIEFMQTLGPARAEAAE